MTDPSRRPAPSLAAAQAPVAATAELAAPAPLLARGRLGLALQYPRGWWRGALSSRFAGWLPFVVTGLGYGYAAAPDFGVDLVRGPMGLVGLVALWLLSNWATQVALGVEATNQRRALRSLGDVISVLAAGSVGGEGVEDPGAAVVLLLRRTTELAAATLRPPPGCEVAAHLLLPLRGKRRGGEREVVGLLPMYHDDYRPERDNDPVPLDAPGVGQAFSTGAACVVSDVAASNPGEGVLPYRSLAALPVVVGAGRGRRVVGVLALDASTPFVFTERNLALLQPVLHPFAQLLGMLIVTHGLEKRP